MEDGFRVYVANSAEQALKTLAEQPNINLILTDVVMPDMTGFELALQVTTQHPRVKVLFMSGVLPRPTPQEDPNLPFIAKPFTHRALTQKVRQVIAKSQARGAVA